MEFSIITISAFVTLLVSVTRYIGKVCVKKDISKFLPIFAIVYGVILAIAGYFTPDVDMGKNIIEAIFLGISTGAAATGINQVGKQLNKSDDVTEEDTQEDIEDPGIQAVREETDIDVPIPASIESDEEVENE